MHFSAFHETTPFTLFFLQRVERAGRNAERIEAVHALPLDEGIFMALAAGAACTA